jgi:hypothetical protein
LVIKQKGVGSEGQILYGEDRNGTVGWSNITLYDFATLRAIFGKQFFSIYLFDLDNFSTIYCPRLLNGIDIIARP